MDERDRRPSDDIAAHGAPASPEALREIVARHQRGRTRTLGILLAVALIAGPIAGWAIGQSGGGGQQVATGSQPNAPTAGSPDNLAAPANGGGVSSGVIAFPDKNPPKATHLFSRTTSDGIVIRAYRVDPPPPPADSSSSTSTTVPPGKATLCPRPLNPGVATGSATANANSGASASASASSGSAGSGSSESGQVVSPPPAPDGTPGTVIAGTPPPCSPALPPTCKAAPSVLGELSNDAAVGQGFDPIDEKQPSDALSHLSVGMFGVPEGAPATFVIVQTGPGVATVRLRLPSGETDEMAPSGGVAVLAHGSPATKPAGAVVEALDSSGKVLTSMDVAQSGPRAAIGCGIAVAPPTATPLPAPATPPTSR